MIAIIKKTQVIISVETVETQIVKNGWVYTVTIRRTTITKITDTHAIALI